MNWTTVVMQASGNSEEAYCSPWDLRIQEERLKFLNEQRQIPSVNAGATSTDILHRPADTNNQSISSLINHNGTNRSSNRPCSVRSSSLTTKKSSVHCESAAPVLPPLPPGGLIPSSNHVNHSFIENLDPTLKKISSCLNVQMIRSGTDTSRSFLFTPTSSSIQCTQKINTVTGAPDDSQSMPFQMSLLHFKRLSSSIQNTSLAPHLSLASDLSSKRNHHGGSLQKIPSIEESKQYCSCISCLMRSPVGRSTLLPIERYFWYHYKMSRRQAENILEHRSPGSFLVRQSESGNANDYSLSIRTTKNCLHMRICYTDGFFVLGECSRPFPSVSSMIEYFRLTSVPIRGATHTKLGVPVSRWEVLSSALSNEELL